MNAPEWRKLILAGVKPLLREHGFRGSKTRFWKVIGDRQLSVQLMGGIDPHDTTKLNMGVFIGIDFLDVQPAEQTSAYLSMWWSRLSWTNSQGTREFEWRAYSDSEALDVLEGIKAALPPVLAKVEERFQTWHDAIVYLDPTIRDDLNPPGRVSEWKFPDVL